MSDERRKLERTRSSLHVAGEQSLLAWNESARATSSLRKGVDELDDLSSTDYEKRYRQNRIESDVAA